MRQVVKHVQDAHNVKNPSQTILDYLTSTVHEEASGPSTR